MVQRYNTDVPIQEFSFTKALFWVQVHEILVCYMTKMVAENFAKLFRKSKNQSTRLMSPYLCVGDT